MEIELRAKVNNSTQIRRRITNFVGSKPKVSNQKDIYLKHSKDKERLLVFRTRETSGKSLFTIKAKNKGGKDHAWLEYETPLNNPKKLRSILLANGFENVVSLTKTRCSWKMKGMEINLDIIKELGTFIEAEVIAQPSQKDKALKRIESVLEKLNIGHKDIIHKGYVQLALEKKKPAKTRR